MLIQELNVGQPVPEAGSGRGSGNQGRWESDAGNEAGKFDREEGNESKKPIPSKHSEIRPGREQQRGQARESRLAGYHFYQVSWTVSWGPWWKCLSLLPGQ